VGGALEDAMAVATSIKYSVILKRHVVATSVVKQ